MVARYAAAAFRASAVRTIAAAPCGGGSAAATCLCRIALRISHGRRQRPPIRAGSMKTTPVLEVATFGDGATLDVPGSPRVVLVPGHTAGHAALVVGSLDAAFVGDAIATRNVMGGSTGPQLAPFGADLRQAYDSLERLDGLETRYVLPGHGQPWTEGLASALAKVRERGRPAGR